MERAYSGKERTLSWSVHRPQLAFITHLLKTPTDSELDIHFVHCGAPSGPKHAFAVRGSTVDVTSVVDIGLRVVVLTVDLVVLVVGVVVVVVVVLDVVVRGLLVVVEEVTSSVHLQALAHHSLYFVVTGSVCKGSHFPIVEDVICL